ncbi:hypothetical protein B296_00041309 [Ensete ventricosum]|uniref:cellulase n=1 Tax=Ensete ventricosum TaxID=4639 RepID=A0A426ZM86_ENSVE|nr:hypothetical protein B296_00041309 [Ensete ventricosum]
MHSMNHWGGSFEIHDPTTDDEHSRNMDLDRAALSRQQLDETQQSWLLGPQDAKKKDKYVDLGCMVVKRKVLKWAFYAALIAFVVIGVPIIIAKSIPKHKKAPPPPDRYTEALHKALMFFNAQKCKACLLCSVLLLLCCSARLRVCVDSSAGRLPKNNGVPWRGDSGLKDGSEQTDVKGGLVGGYYDAGDNIKFHFPMAFSMTLLSWSVIEYSDKYKDIGEYDHVRELIKWGTDYLLKTFNSSATTITKIYSQASLSSSASNP